MMGGIEVLPHGTASTTSLTTGDGADWVAHVSSSGLSTAPTGFVQFQQHGRVLAEVPLQHGEARLPFTQIRESQAPVDALYSGDRFSDPSHGSGSVTHVR